MNSNCPTTWPKPAKISDFVSLKRAHRRILFERLWGFPSLFTDCLQSAFHRTFLLPFKVFSCFYLFYICQIWQVLIFRSNRTQWRNFELKAEWISCKSEILHKYLRLTSSENEFQISFLRIFTNFSTNENQSCVFLLFIFIETIILIVGKILKILKIRKIWNSELVKKIKIYCRIRWTNYLLDIDI